MRFIWLIFVGLVLGMLGLLPRHKPTVPKRLANPAAADSARAGKPAARISPALTSRDAVRRDSLVLFALRQLGTNYCYAGTNPATGFDCSGFVQYVFSRFQVPVPHSTALLIDVGQPVPRDQAQPGDIVVFTGTARTSTTPGHAGIVVTAAPGGPLRFVHSSSARRESGVKISQVEGSDYERRFMQVRRVLNANGQSAAPTPTTPAAGLTRTAVPAKKLTLSGKPPLNRPAHAKTTTRPAPAAHRPAAQARPRPRHAR
jgi:hypothetical protein